MDIVSARIATEIDQALDTFYVHDGKGDKVDDGEGAERVRAALEHALVQAV
jgi:UTP:GlnB (protein PII) uridylyltransferase